MTLVVWRKVDKYRATLQNPRTGWGQRLGRGEADSKKPTLGSALSAKACNQNSAVRGVRGKGITSRTLPMPVT